MENRTFPSPPVTSQSPKITADTTVPSRDALGWNLQLKVFFEVASKPMERKKVSGIDVHGLSFKKKIIEFLASVLLAYSETFLLIKLTQLQAQSLAKDPALVVHVLNLRLSQLQQPFSICNVHYKQGIDSNFFLRSAAMFTNNMQMRQALVTKQERTKEGRAEPEIRFILHGVRPQVHSEFQTTLPILNLTPNSKTSLRILETSLRIPKPHSEC